MTARFEVVRTDAPQPWHARFVAANGRIVWVTENYVRREAAENAICVIANRFIGRVVSASGDVHGSVTINGDYYAIRYVDERDLLPALAENLPAVPVVEVGE